MRRFILIFLLLGLPALARPPEEVVASVYEVHLDTQDIRKTFQARGKCFTPGFLGIIEKALKRQPPDPFVDIDFLGQTQMGLGDYELGKAVITGKDAIVPISLWHSRGRRFASKSERRGSPTKGKIYLTDVGDGDGFQIRDLEFARDGMPKSFKVREWLVPIAEGRRQ